MHFTSWRIPMLLSLIWNWCPSSSNPTFSSPWHRIDTQPTLVLDLTWDCCHSCCNPTYPGHQHDPGLMPFLLRPNPPCFSAWPMIDAFPSATQPSPHHDPGLMPFLLQPNPLWSSNWPEIVAIPVATQPTLVISMTQGWYPSCCDPTHPVCRCDPWLMPFPLQPNLLLTVIQDWCPSCCNPTHSGPRPDLRLLPFLLQPNLYPCHQHDPGLIPFLLQPSPPSFSVWPMIDAFPVATQSTQLFSMIQDSWLRKVINRSLFLGFLRPCTHKFYPLSFNPPITQDPFYVIYAKLSAHIFIFLNLFFCLKKFTCKNSLPNLLPTHNHFLLEFNHFS